MPIESSWRLPGVSDAISRCPRVATQLKPGNPWLPFVSGAVSDPGIGAALETMLSALETAGPPGLATMKKRFKDDDEGNVFGLRTELLLGYLLVEAGIPFTFGSAGQPDFHCELAPPMYIEARTRIKDDIVQLQGGLRQRLEDENSSVLATLTLTRQLVIPEDLQVSIIDRIVRSAGQRTSGHSARVDLPEVEGTCAIEESPFGTSYVFLGFGGSDLSQHMDQAERELLNVIAEKTQQSIRNRWSKDTLLVVEASRLGMAWNRPEVVWAGRLEHLNLDWSSIPFLGLIVMFSGLTSTTARTFGIGRDDIPEVIKPSIARVLNVLGLQTDSDD
jgi:hypothetical protein